jgi:hypothetical protein
MPDDLTSALAGIRELVSKRDETLAWVARASADDGELDAAAGAFEVVQDKLAARAPLLLAAIEAVLALADEWEADSFIVDPEVALRETIRAALTGAAMREDG